MAKKKMYFAEAERLYVVEQCTIAEIASRLSVSEKTVRNWKDEGDWETKRKQYLQSRQTFHEELYQFARKLMQSIRDDLESGEKVDTGRLYAFTRILPMIMKVKDYEDIRAQQEKGQEPSGGAEDIIKIVNEVLGLEKPGD